MFVKLIIIFNLSINCFILTSTKANASPRGAVYVLNIIYELESAGPYFNSERLKYEVILSESTLKKLEIIVSKFPAMPDGKLKHELYLELLDLPKQIQNAYDHILSFENSSNKINFWATADDSPNISASINRKVIQLYEKYMTISSCQKHLN